MSVDSELEVSSEQGTSVIPESMLRMRASTRAQMPVYNAVGHPPRSAWQLMWIDPMAIKRTMEHSLQLAFGKFVHGQNLGCPVSIDDFGSSLNAFKFLSNPAASTMDRAHTRAPEALQATPSEVTSPSQALETLQDTASEVVLAPSSRFASLSPAPTASSSLSISLPPPRMLLRPAVWTPPPEPVPEPTRRDADVLSTNVTYPQSAARSEVKQTLEALGSTSIGPSAAKRVRKHALRDMEAAPGKALVGPSSSEAAQAPLEESPEDATRPLLLLHPTDTSAAVKIPRVRRRNSELLNGRVVSGFTRCGIDGCNKMLPTGNQREARTHLMAHLARDPYYVKSIAASEERGAGAQSCKKRLREVEDGKAEGVTRYFCTYDGAKCEQSYGNIPCLQRHIEAKHWAWLFVCQACGEEFARRYQLEGHRNKAACTRTLARRQRQEQASA
ncbi:hypothetical protein C8Q78DRAFT_989125 [Trametes maxima]|nr:hypothetical protein C8Q78DRAFT_989125 [Trametes maxima]